MSQERLSRKQNNVLLQGTILAAASLIVRLIGLLYRVPLTRILGDEAMGYYSTAFEFYNLALLLSSYSLPLAVSKLVSAREVKGQYKNSRKVFGLALMFGAGVGAIATCVVYFGADLYAKFNKSPLVAIPLRVLAPTIFVFSVMGVVRGYFQGHNNMVPTAISQIVEQVVNAAISIGAAVYMLKKYSGDPAVDAYGAAGGTYGTFFGAVAAALTLLIIFLWKRPAMKRNQLEDTSDYVESNRVVMKAILATVIPVVISQTVYQISSNIDISMFQRLMAKKGYEDSLRSAWWGMYSNKYKLLTNVPIAIASAMGTAIVPSLVAEYAKRNIEGVKERIAAAVKFNMVIAFPCAAGLSFLGGPILRLLFHDTSALSSRLLAVGGVAVVFFALSTVTNGILQGIDHMRIPVLHSTISLAIHVCLLYCLLRFTSLDCLALVIANVAFALLVCVLNWRSIHKYLDYKQEIVKTFVLPCIAALVMGVLAYLVRHFLVSVMNSALATILAILFAVPVYFILLILLRGIDEADLLAMPKGRFLVRVLKKVHLL